MYEPTKSVVGSFLKRKESKEAVILEPYVLIESREQLEEVLDGYERLLLFKHSTRCPVSAQAFDELQRFLNTDAGRRVPAAVVHVIEQREVSNAVSERFGIRHESPQVMWIKEGKVCWHTSHSNITAEKISQAVSEPQ
jgi:bacillithiol system protein YtxJ